MEHTIEKMSSVGRKRILENGVVKENKEYIKNYNKEYYAKTRELRKLKYSNNPKLNNPRSVEIINCECGKSIQKNRLNLHLTTALHKNNLKLIELNKMMQQISSTNLQ
jgi:hypothetical protein